MGLGHGSNIDGSHGSWVMTHGQLCFIAYTKQKECNENLFICFQYIKVIIQHAINLIRQ